MEKKIEEKLIQELEEEKNGKEEKDTNKNELTGEDIKESYSLNTINKSKNIQDPTTEHFSKDENSIKLIKSQKIKKYKLYNFFIGEYEYKDRNKNLSLNKYTYISRWFKDVDITEIEKLITYKKNMNHFQKKIFIHYFINIYQAIKIFN